MLMDDLCKLHQQFAPHLFDDDYEDQNLKVESVCSLTPKGPMSVDGFLGSSGRLSRRQKHE
jgi:hypothetical protein